MKRVLLSSILAGGLLFSGCAVFLLGLGGAGGYAVSKDQIEGFSDASYDRTWQAAKDVLQSEGAITLEDKEHGKMEALVKESTVEANLDQATPKTVRLRVKARRTKGLFPDIKLAQELFTKVIKKVE